MKLFHLRPISLGIALVALSACGKSDAPAHMQMPPPQVSVVTAHAESVPLTQVLVGRLAAVRIAQVRARVAGVILKRVYTEGTDVEQGQVLFQIDPAPLEAALHAEQAALAKARADAANAALISKRYKDLEAKHLISSQDVDTALANERTTAAAVKQAQANVEKAQLDLGYATVTAPISGRAGRAQVTEGALVGQGEATELTTVQQIDPIYVNFSQSVSELEQLRAANANANPTQEASKVEVMLSDGTPYSQAGKLDFSDLAVDPTTGTVSLRAVVPNPDKTLLPGMFVKLRVTMGHLEHAYLLPQATVQRDQAGAFVFVVGAEGKVEQQRVETHGMTRTDWIVTGKLTDGAQVIVAGIQKVRPGAVAKVTEVDGKAQEAAAPAAQAKP
ncbi:MAG: efflux RND transporter periplasmic adaptor subunit [Gammaproteobacteria bacterium]|nr:efflux RND transporter periplasmic adaptor subunit [Gammaproteobacteria bacterium]